MRIKTTRIFKSVVSFMLIIAMTLSNLTVAFAEGTQTAPQTEAQTYVGELEQADTPAGEETKQMDEEVNDTDPETDPATEAPTEAPTEPPTEAPTEKPTESTEEESEPSEDTEAPVVDTELEDTMDKADSLGTRATDYVSVGWKEPSVTNSLDLTANDTGNPINIQYQLDFHSSKVYAPGEIIIRVPYSLYTTKASPSQPVTPSGISIPLFPEESNIYPFHYKIEGNEIVIINAKEVNSGTNNMLQISYKIDPKVTENGQNWSVNPTYSLNKGPSRPSNIITGKITVKQTEPEKPPADELAVNTLTKTKPASDLDAFRYTEKSVGEILTGFKKPADFDSYYYVAYNIETRINSKNAMSAQISFDDQPFGGDVVGYKINNTTYMGNPVSVPYRQQTSGFGATTYRGMVVVRYPKTAGTTLRNTLKVTATQDGGGITDSKTVTAADVNWKDYNFDDYYKGDGSLSTSKTGHEVKDGMALHKNAVDAGNDYPLPLAWSLNDSVQGYTRLTNNSQASYQHVLEEGTLQAYQQGAPWKPLTEDDYYFRDVTLTWIEENYDVNTGERITANRTGRLKFEVMLKSNPGVWKVISNNLAPSIGGATFLMNDVSPADKADGVYKFRITGSGIRSHVSRFGLSVTTSLRHDSPVMKSMTAYNDLTLSNAATSQMLDMSGNVLSNARLNGNYILKGLPPEEIPSINWTAENKKNYDGFSSDSIRGRVIQNWTLTGREYGTGTKMSNFADSDLSRNEAYFYDLLPESTYLDTTSMPTATSISGGVPATVSYTLHDNYKGSGRQLVKFYVKTSQPNKNFHYQWEAGSNKVMTGFKLTFKTYYHWTDHKSANMKYNYSAYQTVDGSFFKSSNGNDATGARADDGSGSNVPIKDEGGNNILYDLAGNGGVNQAVKNTVYSFGQQIASVDVSGQSGVSKSVRGEVWDSYSNEAIVPLDGNYSYRITAQNTPNNYMKDIILFDRLENAPKDRAGLDAGMERDYWQGEFVSVDVSSAQAQGIEAIVYYSTNRDAAFDLQSGDWTTTMPKPSEVRAVAVDLSKRSSVDNGEKVDYVFGPEQSTYAIINMKAPGNLQGPARYAYNNPAFTSSTATSNTPFTKWTTETVLSSSVKTRLIDPTILEVEKELLGNGADPNLEFTFSMRAKRYGNNDFSMFRYQKYTLYTNGVADPLYYFTDVNGEFKLKHNQKAVFEQFEGGEAVQIQEKRNNANDSREMFTYVTPANGFAELQLQGKGNINKMEFVNRYGRGTGETVLGLEKTQVTMPGAANPPSGTYDFQLLVNGKPAAGIRYNYQRKDSLGYEQWYRTNSEGKFTVMAGERYRYEFPELKIGDTYEFIETLPDGFTNSSQFAKGTLDANGSTARFTNYYHGPNAKFEDLEIKKHIVSNIGMIPLIHGFEFILKLDNEILSNHKYTFYKDGLEIEERYTDENGIFVLQHNESAVFKRILVGTKFEVQELPREEYEFESPQNGIYSGTIKEITNNDKNEAPFINRYVPKFNVIYRFVSDSSTPLPAEINNLLPPTLNGIPTGITVPREQEPAVGHEIRTEDGLWVLTNWDKNDVAIVDKDEEFVGTWTFYKDLDPVKGYDVTVNKSADKSSATAVGPNDVITYKLTVRNTGLVTIPYTVVKDVIPEGTTYEGTVSSGGQFVAAGGANPAYVQWTITNLAPNAETQVEFKVKVNASNLPARIKNVGLYKSGDTPDITPDVPTNEIIHTTDPSKPVEAIIDAVKSANPVSGTKVKPTDTIAYTIKVTNTGGSPGKDIYVKDYIPTGTTYTSGGTYVDASASSNKRAYVEWKIPQLAAGASQEVTFNVTVDAPNNGRTIHNQALYENRWLDSFKREPKNATNIVRHPLGTDPVEGYDVTVSKKGNVPANQTLTVGQRITYTLTVKNTGIDTAPITVVKDPIPQGTGYVAQSATHEGQYVQTAGSDAQHVKWVIKNLEPNQEIELQFQVEVLANPPAYIYNVGYYGTGEDDGNPPTPEKPTNPITNTTDEEEPVGAVINAVKKANPVSGSKVRAGDEIEYTMTVTNTGGIKAENVYVRDYIPAGTTYLSGGNHIAASNFVDWKIASLNSGESKDVTFKVTVNTPNDGRTIKNQALFEKDWDGSKPNPDNSTNIVKHTVGREPVDGYTVTVNKTGDRPAATPITPGETIKYTLTAKNTGVLTAPFTVIKDEIPDGTTYVANSASDGGEYVPAAGGQKAYVKWVITDLTAGQVKPVTFDVTVNSNPPAYITNVGHYGTGDNEDTPPEKPTNPITNTTDEEDPVGPVIDVVKSADPASGTEVKAGDEVTYTMKVTNNGGSTAQKIYVRDYIPAGTTYKDGGTPGPGGNYVEWLIPSLAKGKSTEVKFTVTVDEPNNGRTIKNQALYEDGWNGSKTIDPENSTNIVVHPVGTVPQKGYDVTVNKTGSIPGAQVVNTNDTITYTLKVRNTGVQTAPSTVITDEIPEGTTYEDGSASPGGVYTPAAGSNKAFVKWVIKDLEPDQEVSVKFTVKVANDPPAYIYNIGRYGTGDKETEITPDRPTNPVTNTTDKDEPVGPLLDAEKSSVPAAGTEVKAEDYIAYNIRITNNGGLAAKNAYIRDYIPAGTKYVQGSADATGGSYVDTAASANGKAYVEWKIASLAAKGEATVGFKVQVDGPNDGRSVINQAYFDHNWDGTKTEPSNSTNIVKHPVKVQPVQGHEVTVNKSGSIPSSTKVSTGTQITYTLKVKNTGLNVVPFTVVKDELPAGTLYVGSSANEGGTYVAAANGNKAYVQWTVKDLLPNTEVDLKFTVEVAANPPTYIYNVGYYGTGETEDPEPDKPTNPVTNTTDEENPVNAIVDVVKLANPVSGATVKAESEIEYTLKISNTGGITAKNIYIKDYIPAGTAYVDNSADNNGSYVDKAASGNGKDYVQWTIASLAAGDSTTVSFKVTADKPNDGRIIHNQALYQKDWNPANTDEPENSTNVVRHPVGEEPVNGYDVTVNKSGSVPAKTIVMQGDEITYTLQVKNTGLTTVPFTVVKDEIPEGTTYVSADNGGAFTDAESGNRAYVKWTVTNLAPNAVKELKFTVKVNPNPPTYIRNIGHYGSGDSEDPDPDKPTNPITNTTDDHNPVTASVDVVKAASPAAGTTVKAGEDITYTLNITNTGGVAARNVYVKDYIPDGVTYVGESVSTGGTYVDAATSANSKAYVDWKVVVIAPGATAKVSFTVKADAPNNGRIIRNQARYENNWDSTKGLDPENSTNIVKHPMGIDPVKGYDVTVNKSSNVPASQVVKAGDKIEYKLVVKNTGMETVPFTVVKDEIPEGTTYVEDSVSEGGTFVAAQGGNKAYVQWLVNDLDPNTEKSLTFSVEVNENPPTYIFNVGYYGSGDDEENPPTPEKPTNPITNTTDEENPISAIVDAVKSASPAAGTEVMADDDITYHIKVTNTGGSKAEKIYVKDYIPAGTKYVAGSADETGGRYVAVDGGRSYVEWTIDSIDPEQDKTVEFQVRVDQPNDGRSIRNQALYENNWDGSKTGEPENATNIVKHPMRIEPVQGYDITVNKTGSVPSNKVVKVDDYIEYTLKVKNTGLVNVPFTIVEDEIPAGTKYVGASANEGGTYIAAAGERSGYVKWIIKNLAPNTEIDLKFKVQVQTAPPTFIYNVGMYGSGETEDDVEPEIPTNPIINTTDEQDPVSAVVDVVKSSSPVSGATVKMGDTITYTLNIVNTGGVTARNIYIRDYIPAGVTYVEDSITADGNFVNIGGRAYTEWTIATLKAGKSTTVSFDVNVDEPNDGRIIRNQALYEKNWDGSKTAEPENSTNIVKHPVGLNPVDGYEVTVNKVGSRPATEAVRAGEEIEYTLKVKNSGMDMVPVTVVKDEIPEGTTYVDGSVSGDGIFVPAAGSEKAHVKWMVKDLEADAEVTLTFKVTVDQNPPTYIFNVGHYGTGDDEENPPEPDKPTNPITNTTDEEDPVSAIIDVVKSSDPIAGTELMAGDEITYTLRVTNTGGLRANNVYVKDFIPVGATFAETAEGTYVDTNGAPYVEWQLLTLDAKATKELTFKVTVDKPNDGRSIRNQALYENNWDGTKTTPENTTNIMKHPVGTDPIKGYDVTVNKTGDRKATEILKAEDEITYTLTVKNTGLETAPITIVKDEIPLGTTYVQNSVSEGGAFTAAAGGNRAYVQWTVKDLPANAQVQLTFKVKVNENPPTYIYNVGTYGTGDDEENPPTPEKPTNPITNTTDDKEPVNAIIDVIKSSAPPADQKVMAKDIITYNLKVMNTGGRLAKNVYVKDYIPTGTKYVAQSADESGGRYVDAASSANGRPYVEWQFDSLKAQASKDLTFKVMVDEPNNGRIIRNQAMYEKDWDPANTDEPENNTNIVKHPVGIDPVEGYDVTVNKTGSKPASQKVEAGDEISYNLTVKNTGLETAPITVVRDEIPDGTTYVDGSATAGGVYTAAAGDEKAFVQWTVTDLEPDTEETLTFKVTVNTNPPIYIYNIGYYGTGDDEENPPTPEKPTNPITNTTDDEDPVGPIIDTLKSSVPVSDSEVKPGDTITYTMTVINTGGSTAKNIYVKDYVPAGTTYVEGGTLIDAEVSPNGKAYVEWKIATLAKGASQDVTFKVTVDEPKNGRTIRNQALYEANWNGSKTTEPENATNVVKHPIPSDPVKGYDVTVNKRSNPTSAVEVGAGDKIVYTLAVKNSGLDTVPFTVVKDEIPAGTTYAAGSATAGGTYFAATETGNAYIQWIVADLEPETIAELSFTVTVDQNPPAFIYNVGQYGSGDTEQDITPDKPTNTITHTTDEKNPVGAIIDVVKSANPLDGTEVKAGDEITYKLKVENTGGTTAKRVYVRDYIPAGATFEGTLNPEGGNYVAAENSANGRAYVEWTIPKLAKAAVAELSFKVLVNEPNDGRSIKNHALYQKDWDPGNTDEPDNSTNVVKHPVKTDPVKGHDVTVNKRSDRPGATPLKAGDEITYSLTVRNSGVVDVPLTVVKDLIPEGTTYIPNSASAGGSYTEAAGTERAYVQWTLTDLEPDQEVTVSFKVVINQNPPTFIYNVGLYGTGDEDTPPTPEKPTNPITNTTDEDDPVNAVVDVIKSANPQAGTEVRAGEKVTYNLKIENSGGITARNIYVRDYIPTGTTYVDGGTFVSAEDSANGKAYVEWQIAKLAKGASTEVSFTVSVDAPNNGRSLRNQALYEDNWDGTKTTEPEHGTNVVKHPVGVDPAKGYDVTVNKKGDRLGSEVLAEGDEITYTLTVANTGLETAPFTIVKDEIPAGTTYVADSATAGGVYVQAGDNQAAYVKWVVTNLDPDQTADLSFKVVINPEPPIFITNIGMYTSGDNEGDEPDKPTNPVTNTTDEENPVNAVIEVVKGSNPTADTKVKAGDEIEYTLKVKNIGGIAARNVYVRDYVPVGTTYAEGGNFVDAETSANGRAYVEWFFSRVKVDEEQELSFKVTVDGPNDGRTVRNQGLFAKDWDLTKREDPDGRTNIVRHPMATDPVKGYDVTVNKSSAPTGSKVVKAGETIEYVLNVKNTGLVTAPFTVVRDEIPAGTTFVANSAAPNNASFIRADVAENGKAYVQWIVTNLRPTAEVKLSFKVTVNQNPPTFIHNVGLYGAGDNENIVPEEPTNPITHTTDENHPVGAVIDVVKKADPQYGATVRAGEEITYTMTVTNNGGTTAKDIYVRDYIPAGTTYADGGTFVRAADSATGVAYVEWQIKRLAAGASQDVSFKVKVGKPNDGRTIKNQALYEKDWDGTKTGEPDSSTNIVKHPVGTDPVNGYDVTVNKRGSVPGYRVVKPGDQISYTLTAKNTGVITAPFTTVRDEIPAGTSYVAGSATEGGVYVSSDKSANGKAYVQWLIKDLQPNQEKVLTFKIAVNEEPPIYIFNVGKYISGDSEDPDPQIPTNPITNTTDEEHPVGPLVDVIKKAAPAPGEEVEEGDTVTYTMEIFNNGGVEARNIYVKDYIPTGTTLAEVLNDGVAKDNYVEWMIENLAPGAKIQVSFKVTVDGPNDGREIANQALYEDNWDGTKTGEPENSTNNVKHPVKQGFTNIRILKVDTTDNERVLEGAEFILYKEEADSKLYYSKDAEGNVSWTKSENEAFKLVTNSKGIANVTGLTTEGTYFIKETKAPDKYLLDESVQEVVITREGLETTYEITIMNAPDPDSGYLLDELKANVELSKKVDKTKVAANENLTYTVTVKHVGKKAEITDITIMDYIPQNTRFVAVENDGKYGAKNGKEYVSWKIASLKKGESIDLKFTVKVNECSSGTEIKNTAFATRDNTGQMDSNGVTSVVKDSDGSKTPGTRSNGGSKSGSNSRITSRSVKTGDDNLSLYVYALAAILALGILIVVGKKRRRKDVQ